MNFWRPAGPTGKFGAVSINLLFPGFINSFGFHCRSGAGRDSGVRIAADLEDDGVKNPSVGIGQG